MKFLFVSILICNTLYAQDIIRGDTTQKKIALVFTGDEFADGGEFIAQTLQEKNIKASFFLTGNFYRNPNFKKIIRTLKKNGNYLGSHSDKHLLYCDWEKRDSLLVTKEEFTNDLNRSYHELSKWGIQKNDAHYFLPPYEWYNDSITSWTSQMNLQLVNYSPGTRSTADYTYPEMGKRYVGSAEVYASIIDFEKKSPSGLNGFILLVHIGTDPRRTDKFYNMLPRLIDELRSKGYEWVRIDQLL
jgi:peptidoglycan/xylan/chitin deacetylase (PgdA/CDA1 family)